MSNVGSASAQTIYTWTAAGGNDSWLNPNNWTVASPASGFPGVSGSDPNTNIANFAGAGTTATLSQQDGNNGWSLGAIVTSGNSGGPMTVNLAGNGQFRMNGATVATPTGTYNNVAAAAQGSRNLRIIDTNIPLAFGTSGQATTFYADAGRVLTIEAQQVTNLGSALNKQGAGALLMGSLSGLTLNMGGQPINVNAGTFAIAGSLNGVSQINVASGAALQAGLAAGGSSSISANVVFANNAGLRIATNGTQVSQLQNAAVSKGVNDIFRVVLTGLTPTGTATFNPNGIILQASSLTGFDPNGTYTQSAPGHFSVVGDGFIVTNWSLSVENNNQIRLNNITITPIPEPATVMLIGAAGLAAAGGIRRRFRKPSITP